VAFIMPEKLSLGTVKFRNCPGIARDHLPATTGLFKAAMAGGVDRRRALKSLWIKYAKTFKPCEKLIVDFGVKA
jgi:hypothetical protein